MENKVVRVTLLLLLSSVVTAIVFGVLTYTRLAPLLVDKLMRVFGYDVYQGEDRVSYVFNFVIGLLVMNFIVVYFFLYCDAFRKKKPLFTYLW